MFLLVGKYLLRFLSLEQQALSIRRRNRPVSHLAANDLSERRRARRPFPRRGTVRRSSRDTAPRRAVDTRDGTPTPVSGARLDRALTLALTIAWGVSGAILLSSTFFYRVLRERGLIAMERLMGMLLVMVAVQMLLNGLRVFLRQR